MKKILIAAVISLFALSQAEAQVTFRPGIRGGVNFSHFTKGDSYENYYYDGSNYVYTTSRREFSSRTDFYLGMYGALKLTKMYTLQPEVDYSRQGATYEIPNSPDEKLEVSYLSVAVVNKFTFNKFNVHLGPTIEFVVEENFDTDSEVDLGFQLGAGYDITKNFGIEARVKKGIIPVLDFSDSNHTNVVFSLGATYTFDVK
jgi:Outer membrane protein beta-barrel domain